MTNFQLPSGIMKNYIDYSILEYPCLFLKRTYKSSVISVLNHIFNVVGNGHVWHNGYPIGIVTAKNKIIIKKQKKIVFPKSFFETPKEWFELSPKIAPNLYKEIMEDEKLQQMLKTSEETYSIGKNYFFCDKDLIAYVLNLQNTLKGKKEMFSACGSVNNLDDFEQITHPYDICDYSAIYEMVYGKKYVIKEVIPFAKLIVDYCIDYYNDETRYVYHHRYNPSSWLCFKRKKPIPPQEEGWKSFREEQLKLLNEIKDFLNKK